jgi:hypothetical protein
MSTAVFANFESAGDYEGTGQLERSKKRGGAGLTRVASCFGPAAFLILPITMLGET